MFAFTWLLSVRKPRAVAFAAIWVLRFGTALAIAWYHGWRKLAIVAVQWRGGRESSWSFAIEGAAASVPCRVFSAGLAAALQFGVGICLMIGLLTRCSALVIINTLQGAMSLYRALWAEWADTPYEITRAGLC